MSVPPSLKSMFSLVHLSKRVRTKLQCIRHLYALIKHMGGVSNKKEMNQGKRRSRRKNQSITRRPRSRHGLGLSLEALPTHNPYDVLDSALNPDCEV